MGALHADMDKMHRNDVKNIRDVERKWSLRRTNLFPIEETSFFDNVCNDCENVDRFQKHEYEASHEEKVDQN